MNNVTSLLIVVAIINYLPRMLGYLMARKLPAQHFVFNWMRYTTYSIISALSFRLIYMPVNSVKLLSYESRTIVLGLFILLCLLNQRYLLPSILLSIGLLILLDQIGV